jgi:hypothetical protein
MIDYGCASAAAGEIIFVRTYTQLNAADFDQATFYFEVVAFDNNASIDYDVTLRDTTNSTDKATCSIVHGGFVKRIRSTSFTPAAGEVVYAIKLPATGADNDLRVYEASIVVVQGSTATKTVISIPFCSAQYNSTSLLVTSGESGMRGGLSTSYTQETTGRCSTFLKTAANWPTTGISCAIDAVVANTSTSYDADVGLYDIDAAAVVSGAEVSYTAGGGLTHQYTTFAWANMTDGHKFEVMAKSDNAASRGVACRFVLRIILTNLEKGEVYLRVGGYYTGTAALDVVQQRKLYTAANYTNPTCYFEATGSSGSGSGTVELYQDNDYTGTGSQVTLAQLTFSSATKARARTSAIAPTTAYDQYLHVAANANTTTVVHGFLVVAFAGTATDTISVERKTGVGGSYAEVHSGVWSGGSWTDLPNDPAPGDLTNGNTYYYKVRRSIGNSVSDYSTEDSVAYTSGSSGHPNYYYVQQFNR